MNRFVNTILGALLSWLRSLINSVWRLLSSEDGGALLRFLSESWLSIVIGLCLICVLADVVIYFFRWRPDYVWATWWRRMRRKRVRRRQKPVKKARRKPQRKAPPAPQPEPEPAMVYAPLQQQAAAAASAPFQYDFPDLSEPVWDEDISWDDDLACETFGPVDWQGELPPAAPQPEPLSYYRDVQAGFAPALPPEELYAPAPSYQLPAAAESAPVHPGLDDEAFRQNIGLQETEPPQTPVVRAPAFRPFTVTQEPKAEPPQRGTLHRIAQKARDFMSMDDDQRSIRDLQSSVDVSKAFHEPVYPQSFDHNEE